MKILCVGGGSGGHITPIVAVVKKVREPKKHVDIRVWCDRKFSGRARELMGGSARIDIIVSGKWRRYANLSLWTKIRYHIFKTYLRNFIDIFKIAFGVMQSFVKLIIWRPNVIFLKGGFVCLPVGVAAYILKIPIVIHDSDTTPGLTNKILAKFATAIGTGSPVENYPDYPKSKTRFVGVPIRDGLHRFSHAEQNQAKKQLGFDMEKKLIFVAGGGQGARGLNRVTAKIAPKLVENGMQILLMSGKNDISKIESLDLKKTDFRVVEFLTDDYIPAIAAADIVVTRAGATTMAELAAAGKAVIIVPNAHLSGDHQTKNARVYENADAAMMFIQDDLSEKPEILLNAIKKLAGDSELREKFSANLLKFARPNALNEIIEMIFDVAKKSQKSRQKGEK
ncbi:MAG: UDP-N-acetylglucosamine--N-acetylmuramyl-(pentapeptide) pyrophosphoryl-undecaprenol N-acetylglucosamine transferase [Candidatus Nomurabacteria bacterium]|jgi:UDP-N-acetylglucosamine--N-acetylmuramyl-(pentapeptide) pyrophosphoryl-undecaprenol N-acetylglucosamine transferase|nr:UDP-N-acetylglucosamine--N-acetylmuramyl-(pentapeptide) pyrophosphoryl-undecaprenol N-acetylglucosamine transferase [Candidatus Nomurabacteria bacterium]